MINKRNLIEQILAHLNAELTSLVAAAKAAHQAATHEESKPEDQYDTRALEASYLAGAQSVRAAELEKQIAAFKFVPVRAFGPGEPIAPGALVELELSGKRSLCFFVGQGGGFSVKDPATGRAIQIVTPQAPLGEALAGRRAGELAEVESQGGSREYEIISVN